MSDGNLTAVLGALVDTMREGRLDAMAALLDEDVVWDGAVPGTVCHNRGDVLGMLAKWRARVPRLARLEAAELGDHVVVCAEGPDFHPDGVAGPEGRVYLVFTFHDGRVARMRGAGSRDEAWRIAGVPAPG